MELINLENKENNRLIHDAIIRPLKVNRDSTGVLVETLRKDWDDVYGAEREFAMQYYSVTQPGIARDEAVWHYHPNGQEDRFIVVSGAIVAVVADKREESPTKDLLNLFHMDSEDNPYLLVVPKRTLHGFMVVSKTPAVLLNFPTQLYDPKEEGRIPYSEANVTVDNTIFSWDLVRSMF